MFLHSAFTKTHNTFINNHKYSPKKKHQEVMRLDLAILSAVVLAILSAVQASPAPSNHGKYDFKGVDSYHDGKDFGYHYGKGYGYLPYVKYGYSEKDGYWKHGKRDGDNRYDYKKDDYKKDDHDKKDVGKGSFDDNYRGGYYKGKPYGYETVSGKFKGGKGAVVVLPYSKRDPFPGAVAYADFTDGVVDQTSLVAVE